MKKKALYKSIFKEIKDSKTRFLSILGIIFLGTSFYAGISVTGPDMQKSVDDYANYSNFMDAQVYSSYGLVDNDIKLLEDNKDILEYEKSFFRDVNQADNINVVRFFSYDNKNPNQINKFEVMEGRKPQNKNEIAIDYKASEFGLYKLNNSYEFMVDKNVSKKLKVVGFVNSPLYLNYHLRDSTLVGNGSVEFFALIDSSYFDNDVYSQLFIKYKNVQGLHTYSQEYQSIMDENIANLKMLFKDRDSERLVEIKKDSLIKINKAKKEIINNENKLSQAKIELNNANNLIVNNERKLNKEEEKFKQEIKLAQQKIDNGLIELENQQNQLELLKNQLINNGIDYTTNEQYVSGLIQLEQARKQLSENQKILNNNIVSTNKIFKDSRIKINNARIEYINGLNDYNKGIAKLEDAKTKLKKSEDKLNKLKEAEYFFKTREDNAGFIDFKDNSLRIDSIAKIFPVFFFMIAALVTLTTMTRMVDENRSDIGLLKALGYSNFDISLKYIIYGSVAAIIGSILGVIVGSYVFPMIIIDAYQSMYSLANISLLFHSGLLIQSLIVALLCTIGSALVVLRYDLFNKPANLMRPKAPKNGQRIFLERIKPIWNRLNFMKKVTARNLFRYKIRMLMTIIGIAGCTALVLTGFGLKDSISNLPSLQFEKVWKYDAILTYDTGISDKNKKEIDKYIISNDFYKDSTIVALENFSIKDNKNKEQKISLTTFSSLDNIEKYVSFADRITNENYVLDDNGIFISEKLANIFSLSKGDYIKVSDANNKEYSLKINHIIENYLSHQIYMSSNYYYQTFNRKPVYESKFVLLKDNYNKSELGSELMKNDNLVNVTFLEDSNNVMNGSLESLNVVIWVLIVSAGLLAFIVLYNLININIAERIRELSTIKVLGFYDREVSMYIFRENIVLTIIGILFGFGVGSYLHKIVLKTAEVDQAMFAPSIFIESYLYSALITLSFAIFVMLLMHKKMAKINMIDALKSYE